jgi:hypothetical protein
MYRSITAVSVVCFAVSISCILHGEANGLVSSDEGLPSGIVWYGVLDDGIAEAKASGKPIMLLSAAPQCAGVPGMW